MIKTVFFDLDGTLRHSLPSGGEFFAEHAIRLGLKATQDDRLRALRWEHYYWANSPEQRADRLANPNERDFWSLYARRQLMAMGASETDAAELGPQINEYMATAYKPKSVVHDEVPAALRALQDRGYTLGVISNRDRPYMEELTGLGLTAFFALVLAGGEVGMFKPEPGIFLHACECLKTDPAQTAYVGDNYFADVIGARRAGLQPVLYDPRGIFPDAGCAVIRSFGELVGVVG